MIGTHYDDLKKKIYNADLQENRQESEKTISGENTRPNSESVSIKNKTGLKRATHDEI